jgi:hypothetical protein
VIQFAKISLAGWKNAFSIANGTVELIVLADVGPRVLRYSFLGGENQFHEFPAQLGATPGPEFRLYGGHRLWVWPETPRTYFPDNHSVEVSQTPQGLTLCAPIEAAPPGSHLQKKIELQLSAVGSHVTLIHTITNCGNSATRLAPWTPTILKPGGRAILPFPPRAAMDADHFQSVGPLTLWSFTDFTDPRWILGQEFLQLLHSPNPAGRFLEQMSGLFNPAGWGAYFRDGYLFLKRTAVLVDAAYPDFGCNFEIFTNPDFLELETLGPVVDLLPGESTSHIENWWLYADVPSGEGDSWIRSAVLPLAAGSFDAL